jgi:hypothetical protein
MALTSAILRLPVSHRDCFPLHAAQQPELFARAISERAVGIWRSLHSSGCGGKPVFSRYDDDDDEFITRMRPS